MNACGYSAVACGAMADDLQVLAYLRARDERLEAEAEKRRNARGWWAAVAVVAVFLGFLGYHVNEAKRADERARAEQVEFYRDVFRRP